MLNTMDIYSSILTMALRWRENSYIPAGALTGDHTAVSVEVDDEPECNTKMPTLLLLRPTNFFT